MNEVQSQPVASQPTANPRRLVFAFIGVAMIHFFATWLMTAFSWNHDWAEQVAEILWKPCGELASTFPSGKNWVMLAMLCSSLVWASVALLVVLVLRRLFWHRSAQHQAKKSPQPPEAMGG